MKRLTQFFRRFGKTDLGETLGHAKNFFIGDVSTKALGFISMPVFTRLMDEEDYGIVAVYTAALGLLTTLTTLNASDGISRYYYEKEKEDFGEFLSSVVQFILLIQIPIVLVFLFFRETAMGWLDLPPALVYFLLIGLFYRLSLKIFQQILVSRKMSKQFVWVNVVQSYGGFGLSWLLLAFATGAQYVLRIMGFTLMQLASAVYMAIQSWAYIVWGKIKWEHIRYSLQFALPRLPYVLSGIILSQFDRIMLNNMAGAEAAGLYSVGYNVGGLSLLVIGAITPALLPNFYHLMNKDKHSQVDRLNRNIMWIVVAAGIGLMLLGGGILRLLADERFHDGAVVVPAVVMGYMFYALAGVYNRFSGYYKMTILQSIGALLAGGVNILLNYLWIPRFGIIAAAYATVISYGIQAVLTWLLVSRLAKGHVTSIKHFLIPVLLSGLVFLVMSLW